MIIVDLSQTTTIYLIFFIHIEKNVDHDMHSERT